MTGLENSKTAMESERYQAVVAASFAERASRDSQREAVLGA